jgi:peptidoglycan/xylan/chitin deacetylase (PgdA/CDA1 family)
MGNDALAGNVVILMYHRISDDGTGLCVSPDEFFAHMALLCEARYRVLSLSELAAALQLGNVLEKSVAITLDDGYLDALTHAAPILQRFGFPATFFIISSSLDGESEFWWEALERIFAHDGLPADLDTGLPDGVTSIPTRGPQEKRVALDTVRRMFFTLGHEQQRERVAALLRWAGLPPADPFRDVRPMTSGEIQALDRLPGMEIGAHTEHHLLLPAQSTVTKRFEIAQSKLRLEELLGHEVQSLSYPHGAFDEESVRLAGEAGFCIAVTTGNQPAGVCSHPLVLPRLAVRARDDLCERLREMFATSPITQQYDRNFT